MTEVAPVSMQDEMCPGFLLFFSGSLTQAKMWAICGGIGVTGFHDVTKDSYKSGCAD